MLVGSDPGGFVNAVLLFSLSLYVALDAIPRLFRPPVLDGSDEWVAIAAIGMSNSKVCASCRDVFNSPHADVTVHMQHAAY